MWSGLFFKLPTLPEWEHPYKAIGASRIASGNRNPLGTRWIGFHTKGGGVYGIHGTNDPASVGKFVSHGCVRMLNKQVEELFELIDYGTPVNITYNRYQLQIVGDYISLEVFPDPYNYKSINLEKVVAEIKRFSPYAQINYDLLAKAIKDVSEQAIYEVAFIEKLGRTRVPGNQYSLSPRRYYTW